MPSQLALPFKQARNYHQGRVDKILFIVVHDGETLELPRSAEGMQDYFAGPDAPQASAHTAADVDSLVRSVNDWDTAWAAPGANAFGLHLEQAGKASQGTQGWNDPYSKKMITEQSARQLADWSVRYHIPLVKRGPDDLNARRGGVVGHIDVTIANKTAGGHTDPGQTYPWSLLIGASIEHTHDIKPVVVVHNPYPLPQHVVFTYGASGDKVRFVQWALGIPVDGQFGNMTLAAVKAFQHKHGLRVDGICGPQTLVAMASITHTH